MDTLDCGHVAYAASRRVCRHLLVEEPPTFVGLLTGVGVDYDLACDVCADNPARELLLVCEGCVARAADWDSITAWRGTPEIRIQDRLVIGRWSEFGCSFIPQNDWCVAPLPLGWAIVTRDLLILLDQAGEVAAEYSLSVTPEPPNEWTGHVRGLALHTSPDGLFAAVVTDYGQFGQVIDLETGARPLVLDRGSYHNETTPFPVCCVTVDGDAVVVAATAWNRLDTFLAATGRLLTSRETEWVRGQPRPEHYLDYFHGRLLASPGGRWILDDGWVWSPVGVPTVIDVAAWLSGQIHTAENGAALSYRAYAWDQPVAWLDDHTVAIRRVRRAVRTNVGPPRQALRCQHRRYRDMGTRSRCPDRHPRGLRSDRTQRPHRHVGRVQQWGLQDLDA